MAHLQQGGFLLGQQRTLEGLCRVWAELRMEEETEIPLKKFLRKYEKRAALM